MSFNRSEWHRGKSLEFKTRDRGFVHMLWVRASSTFCLFHTNT